MACAVAAGAVVLSAAAQPVNVTVLNKLDRGEWELRFRDDSMAPRRICLGDGSQLIQLRHAGLKCRYVVVNDTANEMTVQYTCPGNGYGLTNIRRETAQLAQLDSQGIANGTPFAFAAEVRRVGECRK